MKLAGITDVGKVRQNNEDNFAFGTLENAAYAIVCDGMGGVAGGEIASEIATNTIREQIENAFSPKMKAAVIERMLTAALTAANVKVHQYALQNHLEGMGTTAVAALMTNSAVFIGYDGDSRAYLLRDSMRQLTTDHTYINELLRLGQITEEESLTDPRKNIITRALGVSEEIDVDLISEDIAPDDILLLCTDGLTNCLNDEQILEIIRTQTFSSAPQLLIDKANENGGVDNITAVLMQCEEEDNG